MRILILSWEYPPHVVGGLGKHVTELVPALVAEGVEVYVITPLLRGGLPSEVLPNGGHVLRVAVPPIEDYEFISFVIQANREMEQAAYALHAQLGGFDIIHAHDWLTASAGMALKHTWRTPLVATIHATERGRGCGQILSAHAEQINTIEWWLTYEAWRVIICSQFMAREIADYFTTPIDKIDLVPNGITIIPNPFATPVDRQLFRRNFAADNQSIVYFVGRVVYEKGLGVLLAAWPQILAAEPARLLIAGAGGYLDTLKAQAQCMGISDSVTFTGFISAATRDKLYYVADVAVFPSLYEAFGIVALEAMAAGCPVVVSATGGLDEVVRAHYTGITVEPDRCESLAWGVLHTLQHPEWSRARATNALAEVQDRYNWRRIARETIAIYHRVYREWLSNSWGQERL